MLAKLDNITDNPPVGHSITGPSTGLVDHKGSTSPGGPLPAAGNQFVAGQREQYKQLKKATATEQLAERLMARLDRLEQFWQDDDAIQAKLEKVALNHLVISETLLVDRLQAIQGKATQIIGVQHQDKLDQMLPALLDAIKQRGLEITATERKLEVSTS